MSKIDDGGPVHPSPGLIDTTDERSEDRDGMSLRDWFAGMALQGAIAVGCFEKMCEKGMYLDDAERQMSTDCYRLADVLIAEKRRTETT